MSREMVYTIRLLRFVLRGGAVKDGGSLRTAIRNLEITKTFLVAMRLRETPVPIPNTMVKT